MKNTMWMGLCAATVLPLYIGCAQAPVVPAPEAEPPAALTAPPAAGGAPQVQAAGPASVPANISPATTEVIRLAESGVTDDVVLAYVQNSQASFGLSADVILYLRDLGLSSQAITAMINRDVALGQNHPQPQPSQQYAPAPAPAPAVASPPPVEAAPPVYVSNAPAEVNYFYND